MPGLGPGIHALLTISKSWMAGTSPAMTAERFTPVNESVMSEDFLKNPLSLFDVRGKTAVITGATGAFGALAAKVLAGAGCNLVLAAGGADALKAVAAECEGLGAKTEGVNLRPNSAANCDKIVEAAVKRFGGVDILVLASGINKVSKIVDQAPETFMEVIDVNVTQS